MTSIGGIKEVATKPQRENRFIVQYFPADVKSAAGWTDSTVKRTPGKVRFDAE